MPAVHKATRLEGWLLPPLKLLSAIHFLKVEFNGRHLAGAGWGETSRREADFPPSPPPHFLAHQLPPARAAGSRPRCRTGWGTGGQDPARAWSGVGARREPAGTPGQPWGMAGRRGSSRQECAGERGLGRVPPAGQPRSRQSQVTTPAPARRAARRSPYMGRRGAGGEGPAWAGRPTRWVPPRGQTEPSGEGSLHGQDLPSGAPEYPEATSRLRPARHPALQGLNLTDSTGD